MTYSHNGRDHRSPYERYAKVLTVRETSISISFVLLACEIYPRKSNSNKDSEVLQQYIHVYNRDGKSFEQE